MIFLLWAKERTLYAHVMHHIFCFLPDLFKKREITIQVMDCLC